MPNRGSPRSGDLRLGGIWLISLGSIFVASLGSAEELVNIKHPVILWAYKASQHFIAAPVAENDSLYVSGLGAFNSAVVQALAIDPQARPRERWSMTAPEIKLPVVSPPAIVGDKLYFGSGMHQTDGAVLYCVKAATGRSVWQLPVTGQLVHLEGSPVVAGNRLFIGGGNAGVLAVDLTHGALDGHEQPLAEIESTLDKRWHELQAKYEEDKRRDPDLAFPPNPDSLPKPTPKILWNAGKNQWHVDASVCLAGDRLLANSAYLDREQQGERAVICLRVADGKPLWKTPLKYNPWAAPVVVGETVMVATSSIRLDPTRIAGAKGEILALELKTGAIIWRRELAGGVVSACAVVKSPAGSKGDAGHAANSAKAGDGELENHLVIVTATDGQVRAFDLRRGEPRWSYAAGTPIFAGAVAAGDMVYIADLKAVVHGLDVATGVRRWTVEIASDPAVQAPGMVYGTPLFRHGRLYVATCNLGDADARRVGVVVCLGDR